MPAFGVETVSLDLPPLVAGFSRRLRDAGLPAGPERAERFARALALTEPVARRRLYWTARAVFVSDPGQVRAFDAVFAEVFGGGPGRRAPEAPATAPAGEETAPAEGARPSDAAERPLTGAIPGAGATRRREGGSEVPDRPVPVVASAEEVLRDKRFDALTAEELAAVYRLMARLRPASPRRRTRRRERCRHGAQVDLRRSLRSSLRTGGEPVRLAHRRRRIVPRRVVALCDISGSMEPYARVYLQFLAAVAAGGADTEAFVFATRLTRLTRALRGDGTRSPDRAIARAAAAAPDWSGGTRIAEALKAFTDRYGRRGMARGAVLVILSDGWERGEPAALATEMERLSRLAHRIIWVNPRVAASAFSPRAGGMAAALPFCDALVSGHSLAALEEVVAAIAGDPGTELSPPPAPARVEETWASATPVAGSSVAMPSGYGPSRGRTTPGWTGGS